jgi:hypothetical protein
VAGHCSTLHNAYPTLHDFLTITGIGGKVRKTATVLFFFESGKVKACLNDRESGAYAFVSGDGCRELLEALEGGLAKGGLDWRQKKGR